eukprot:3491730-Rhodomonas_salina.1
MSLLRLPALRLCLPCLPTPPSSLSAARSSASRRATSARSHPLSAAPTLSSSSLHRFRSPSISSASAFTPSPRPSSPSDSESASLFAVLRLYPHVPSCPCQLHLVSARDERERWRSERGDSRGGGRIKGKRPWR